MMSHVKVVACALLGLLAACGAPLIGGFVMLLGHWLLRDNNKELFYRSMLPAYCMGKAALKFSSWNRAESL